jgi:hypothetical protein
MADQGDWSMKMLFAVIAAGVCCVSAAAAAPARLTLAKGGHTDYTIVTSKDASPSETRAAAELQHFLGEMTGATFAAASETSAPKGNMILVGRSGITDGLGLNIAYDKLGKEGFALKTVGRHVVIAGGRQRGTMYGVSTFLEKLGCRWVAPDVNRIPKTPTLLVPALDEIQTPDFEYREVYMGEAFDKDWAARNKTNGQSTKLDASTGGKIAYHPFVHSFYSLVPPDKYFKEHPEYFSEVDGRRRGEQAQLCLTNPDVLRITIEQVLRWMKEFPDTTITSVSQNDFGGWCECARCRRVEQEEGGALSGPLVRFVNAVAEAVEKEYPDKLIDTLAYYYSEAPPTQTHPRRNVRIRMCPIGACNAHPYEKCPHNAYIVNNLKAWNRMTNNMYIWHYNANFSHFLLPVPDFDELAADIPMYKRSGVVGLFMQGAYAPGSSDGALRAYVLSKLLWNSKTDVWKTVDEFCDIYYGKAARPMRAYLERVHKLVRPAPEGEAQHWWCCRAPAFSDGGLAEVKGLFEQALAAAGNDAVRKRVRAAQMSIRYLELRRQQQFAIRDAVYEPRDMTGLDGRFRAFADDAKTLGVGNFGEDGPFDKYTREFLESLKSHPVVTLKNAALQVKVVPELNGRVISMVDTRTGKELLNQPVSVEMNYPDRSGLSVSAYPDFVNAAAYPVQWKVANASERELTLEGSASNGLRIRRVLRLEGDAWLRADALVENGGSAPIDVTLQAQFDADPGPLANAVVEFRAANGEVVRRELIRPGEQPAGGETYSGGLLPAREWRVRHTASGLSLANMFAPDQVDRAVLGFSGKSANRVGLSLWSKKRTLKPGEQMRLDVEYVASGR